MHKILSTFLLESLVLTCKRRINGQNAHFFNIADINCSDAFQKAKSDTCSCYHSGLFSESSPEVIMNILKMVPTVLTENSTFYLF